MIKSPYNFVPFPKAADGTPEKIFCPEDAASVSHDHPYEDGLSGHLDINLEATTPIYVRNNGDHREYRDSGVFRTNLSKLLESKVNLAQVPVGNCAGMKEFLEYVSFNKICEKHAIPATSLKGAIRTILQIATKGRCEPVNNRRYSVRDLTNRPLYVDWFTSSSNHQGHPCYTPKPKAAFLERDAQTNQYKLVPCEFSRIQQTTLEGLTNNIDLGQSGTAAQKYAQLERAGASLMRQFYVSRPSPQRHSRLVHGQPQPYYLTYDLCTVNPRPNAKTLQGTIVLTGQPSPRTDLHAKHMEFFFHSERPQHELVLSDSQVRDFLDSHADTNGKPSPAWQYWKDKMSANLNQRVPVFYLAHATGSPDATTSAVSLGDANAKLHSFGLSLLYRLPYRLTLQEAIPADHRPPVEPGGDLNPDTDPYPDFQPDFVSTLLGEARSHRALKGRVSFSALTKTTPGGEGNVVVTVLGGPKPSFYRNYMKRDDTLMDPNARLRGWKFYPARADHSVPSHAELPDGNTGVATGFRPLNAGTKFEGKIRFHNLRPHELGALLWALTWGLRPECRHRIGMAKPLGYGCAKIGIIGGEIRHNDLSQPAAAVEGNFIVAKVEEFESWLKSQRDMEGWLNSPSVNDLLMMARHDHGVPVHRLQHPPSLILEIIEDTTGSWTHGRHKSVD